MGIHIMLKNKELTDLIPCKFPHLRGNLDQSKKLFRGI
jgi:hypothetical protein